ncbi:MAG: 30S ribosomal protein S8e [Candidatus Aenigmatarchaeota archaeon]|nr:30S ribosomal protein S8e [Candidatus Aenigmarchaeota archaeon]
MAKYHEEIKGRTPTGAKFIPRYKVKKKCHLGGDEILVELRDRERKIVRRTKGGNKKFKLRFATYANVFDGKNYKKVKILDVIENKAHPLYERRKIITKGAIIKTEIGLAKVTSRPSQHGVVNAILIQKS